MQKRVAPIRVGLIGTGFLARGLVLFLEERPEFCVSRVLTRRPLESCREFPRRDLLTHSVDEVLDGVGIVVEASGDPIHATMVVARALEASLPVVTMDSEFHVTTGSFFVNRGYVTEAEGDQPGTLAVLAREAESMGFRPLVYGNIKGYLEHRPSLESMMTWSRRQGISLTQVTSFTDGTKLQIEQALIANGLGADIVRTGLVGALCDDVAAGAAELAELAAGRDRPISAYVLGQGARLPAGVFVTAAHTPAQRPYLEYLKLGAGPHYTLVRNYHLCHLEMARTLAAVIRGEPVLLDNSSRPRFGVAAVAKRALRRGETIVRGIGGFEVRGETVALDEHPRHVPIGLLAGARIIQEAGPGEILSMDQVELPPSLALDCWLAIRAEALRTETCKVDSV